MLARASEGAIAAVEALGEDVWLRRGGMLEVSTTPAQDAAVEEAIRAAAELGVPERAVPVEPGISPVFRRGVRFPDAATVQPARLVRALRRAALGAGVVLHERSRVDLDPPGRGRRPRPARLRAPRGRRRRERLDERLASGEPRADAVRELRRPHRAGARAARRDRLDGRRGDRRRPDVPPLLPDDRGRARADGLRLRADRPQRPDRRAVLRRRGRRSRGPSRGCAGCCPGSPRRGSSGRGAGRSTSPATSCPSSRPCPARGSTTAPATRGTASARAGSAGRSSPRSCSAPTTSGRACRSRGGRRRACRPSPSATWAARSCAGRSSSVEAADEAGRRPPLLARGVAALPRVLGLRIGTR